MESNNYKKPELLGITPQSDTEEVLRKLVSSLEKQGFKIQNKEKLEEPEDKMS